MRTCCPSWWGWGWQRALPAPASQLPSAQNHPLPKWRTSGRRHLSPSRRVIHATTTLLSRNSDYRHPKVRRTHPSFKNTFKHQLASGGRAFSVLRLIQSWGMKKYEKLYRVVKKKKNRSKTVSCRQVPKLGLQTEPISSFTSPKKGVPQGVFCLSPWVCHDGSSPPHKER